MNFLTQETRVGGCKIQYREAGSAGGPVLLFLHGAGGPESALPMLSEFADSMRVLVPDHPGFGASDDPDWLDNIHDAAYAYLDFLEALDLRDVHLVGASLGGWLAMEIAVRDRSRLSSLTLIAAAGIRPGDIPTGDLFMWSPEERVRNTIADPSLAEKILSKPRTQDEADVALRNHTTTAKLCWEPRFFDPDLEKWLHRLRLPTQVVWGADDRLFPPALGRKLSALIPNAPLHLIEACGHVPAIEQPEKLAQLLREFFEKTELGA